MSRTNGLIWLPRTPEEFDTLVERICKKFNLTERDHAAVVISAAISHIDNNTATTTLDYLGQSVLKNIANQIAFAKTSKIKHEAQVRFLADTLKQNPGNQQARDELEAAAKDGSKSAQAVIDQLSTVQTNPLPTGMDLSEAKH